MEVLPSSDVQYVGETESQQHAVGALVHEKELNGFDSGNQVQIANGQVSDLTNSGQKLDAEREIVGQRFGDEFPLTEGQRGASCSDVLLESQMFSVDSHDFEDDDLNVQDFGMHPHTASESSHIIVDTIENDQNGYLECEADLSVMKWLERDESVALWVKWRGKWQAGIRCARADWPLSTLKAKPTHERKKYFVIFFPHTKNYSWADMLLVRSINEFPEPIAYRNHKVGRKMVKDLTVARRFIMKKLAIGILNMLDQFHAEALIDSARDAKVWKDFAVEVSQCRDYSDLGRMLLKLQSIMMQQYINSEWMQQSLSNWVQQCQAAQSAEIVELLREELFDSILWNEVNSLQDAPVQSALGAEWKIWKEDVMKLFLASHSIPEGANLELLSCDTPSTMGVEISRKRPKLEVRRAEPHAFQVETSYPLENITVEIDSEFFNNRETLDASTISSELSKEEDLRSGCLPKEPPCTADTWPEIVVEAAAHSGQDVEKTPTGQNAPKKFFDSGNRSKQCTAFIESKGRQCVRWANEGDVYCCVHLASRFTNSVKAEASPLVSTQPCGGTTVHGTKCKHRSLPGSSFCKKHRPKTAETLKRKHGEVSSTVKLEHGKYTVPMREAEPQLSRYSAMVVDGKLENPNQDYIAMEMSKCIGSSPLGGNVSCPESPNHYSLYCENHIPSWLKRARNGRTRIISKDVFTDILNSCHTIEQKLHLHQACELFYKLFKSIQSLRNPVPTDIQLDWALSEASKSFEVGDLLLKLTRTEKERLRRMWGFAEEEGINASSSIMDKSADYPLSVDDDWPEDGNCIKCKICSQECLDDQELGNHFMDKHKKDAQWLFGGYACAICLDSFRSKEVLETHVQERHHVPFVEQCMLLQCIPCSSHFGNAEELWVHVVSVHPLEFRMKKGGRQQNLSQTVKEVSVQTPQPENTFAGNNLENYDGMRKFTCKFCGMKFDLLPDLGRHNQAAHKGPSPIGADQSGPKKKGVRYYAYRLKSGRLTRPRFKKGLGVATYGMKNRGNAFMKKRVQSLEFPITTELVVQPHVRAAAGGLAESQCSAVAKKLFGDIKKTKPRPSNLHILAIARTACCNVSLKASLEAKFGILPERLFLKAAKLCSEHNVYVEWHREGFVCPRGCKSFKEPGLFAPAMSRDEGQMVTGVSPSSNSLNKSWEVDECHYVINRNDIREVPIPKAATICHDISSGKESIPVACVVDEDLLDSLQLGANESDCQVTKTPTPWKSFEYITRPLLSESDSSSIECLHLGCACPPLTCCSVSCDHVYLFDHDYEDAKDVYGKPMLGRFPYDDKRRIVLEEGYLVYECNDLCKCSKTCPNRVLQNGVRLRLEVFWTVNKGWAVRAGEPILRGMFVCEYIGEVLDRDETKQRRDRCGKEGCSYMFNVDRHTNDMSRLIEGEGNYVIDTAKYGNVSRFINHSCSPNLVSYQVVVGSMDPQRAHIGLYANRDIALGEELTFNYRYELLPGEGCPCLCGSSNCRRRLY